ncbi:MAG: YqgE/AlgH family protein [Pseudomonadota bacterium]
MTTNDDNQDFLTGHLLIAMPNMGDERFARSVVLMCSHERDHAMGVIVNKAVEDVTTETLARQLEIAIDDARPPAPVFMGGPVQQERGLVVHTPISSFTTSVCSL